MPAQALGIDPYEVAIRGQAEQWLERDVAGSVGGQRSEV